MITGFYFLGFLYFLLLIFITMGMFRLERKYDNKIKKISIIVAARNEAIHLPHLLPILLNQNYPRDRYEVVIANDRSNDKTEHILEDFQKKYNNLKIAHVVKEKRHFIGKKNAINEAIKISSNPILALTDADCLPTKNWLKEVNKHFTENVDYVAGYSPLIPLKNPSFLLKLKNFERKAIFALTAGTFGWHWPVTCSARNISYRKRVFDSVNGFESIGKIPSGDDDLLLQKMNRNINKMRFMFTRDSIIPSYDKDNLNEQIHLETRRASKLKYHPLSVKLLTVSAFLFYLSIIVSFLHLLIWDSYHFLYLCLLKMIPELIAISIFLLKMKELKNIIYFLPFQVLYVPYFIFFGLKGTFGEYKWK